MPVAQEEIERKRIIAEKARDAGMRESTTKGGGGSGQGRGSADDAAGGEVAHEGCGVFGVYLRPFARGLGSVRESYALQFKV